MQIMNEHNKRYKTPIVLRKILPHIALVSKILEYYNAKLGIENAVVPLYTAVTLIWCNHFGKQFANSQGEEATTPFLAIYFRETLAQVMNFKSIFSNSKSLETIKTCINGRMNKHLEHTQTMKHSTTVKLNCIFQKIIVSDQIISHS